MHLTRRRLVLLCGLSLSVGCRPATPAPVAACRISSGQSRIAWQYGAGVGGIRGRVLAAATAQPIGGALIRTEPATSRVVTDSMGRFQLALPRGTYVLRVMAIGYDEARDSISLPGLDGFELLAVLARPTPGLIGCG